MDSQQAMEWGLIDGVMDRNPVAAR
jgi:hypothetical protein